MTQQPDGLATSLGGSTVRVVLSGSSRVLESGKADEAAAEAVALFSQATDRSKERVDAAKWDKLLLKGPCIAFDFPRPVVLQSKARPDTKATAIILDLSDQSHPAFLVRDGGTIYSPFIGFPAAGVKALREKVT